MDPEEAIKHGHPALDSSIGSHGMITDGPRVSQAASELRTANTETVSI